VSAVLAGAALVASCAALARVPNLVEAPGAFLLLFALAFLGYGTGVWLLGGAGGGRAAATVLVVAAAARLVLVPAPPTLSTDAYRYVWDARVARSGISPYAYPADAPELRALRDQTIYPRLNHPGWRTIYPPGAHAFFGAVHALRPDSVMAMKLALGAAELAGLALLLGVLRRLGLPAGRAVIYAWNPLLLVEVWGTAHLDALVIPAVVGATWAALAGRQALAGALLGAGALIKLYPAALLPLLLRGSGALPAAAAFGAVLLAGYGPVLSLGLGALGSLPRYMGEEYFNPGLLRSLVDPPGLSAAAVAVWVAAVALRRRDAPLVERAVPLVGGFVLLGPNLFPWYAVWLVPFLALAPSVPWILFTGTVACAYAFFLETPWAVPWWARLVEYAPLVGGALWWAARRPPVALWRERST
jgi:hypothetical protein